MAAVLFWILLLVGVCARNGQLEDTVQLKRVVKNSTRETATECLPSCMPASSADRCMFPFVLALDAPCAGVNIHEDDENST